MMSPGPEVFIWDEQPVAAVTIGLDRAGKSVTRRFHVVSLGSELPSTEQRRCGTTSLTNAAASMHASLLAFAKMLPGAEGDTSVSEAQRNEAEAKLDGVTDDMIDVAITRFHADMAACVGKTSSALQLAIVQRQCDERAPQCGDRPLLFADAPQALAFTVLNRWADTRNTGPTLPPNVMVVLPNLADTSRALSDLSSGKLDELRALDGVRWPDVKAEPDAQTLEEAQNQFEALVVRARLEKKKLERNTARLVDVPTEIAVRVVDVLGEPQEAVLDLRTVVDAKLRTISDELARTRIVECARYRGLSNVVDVAGCAGYKLTDLEMQDCLAGGRCVPPLSTTAYASVLAMLEVHPNLHDLARGADLPRVRAFLGRSIDAALKPLGECAKVAKADRTAAAECLLKDQLGETERRAYACFRDKAQKDTLGCALGAFEKKLPPEIALALTCSQQFKDTRDQAVCVAGARLPREMVELMRCQRESGNDSEELARCMAGKLVGGDAAKALSCVEKHGADYAEAAMCFAGPKLPRDAALAVQCAQNSSDATSAAACYGAKTLPVGLRKPVQCLAESGGDPIGTGVCMAADSLTPEQRIVLQCLVSTSGEPTAMAVCTGGRLAMKEFFNCVDKKVFEGDCVGRNNVFRKLVESLTGQPLQANTVLGHYLNFQLDVVKTQIAFAQAGLKGAEKLTQNLTRETERAAQNIARETERVAQNIARETERAAQNFQREVSKAPDAVARGAQRLGKKVAKEGGKLIKKVTPKIRVRFKKPKWL
jgi:hypothetical protein